MNDDEGYMRMALEEAHRAFSLGEVPIGAVITREGDVLARAHNSPILLNDPSAHAEMLAIRRAAGQAGNYRLVGATLYVTIEPCIMCAGAILQARLSRVVFGAADPKGGAFVSLYRMAEDVRLNHRVQVTEGVLENDCREILGRFFRQKRVHSSP
ncbi:MAG: nucleoside deaminase [Deltaproteobacteria bacterium]|nr:nucleoside deaminase [Deltaproteobacteria bacterium]